MSKSKFLVRSFRAMPLEAQKTIMDFLYQKLGSHTKKSKNTLFLQVIKAPPTKIVVSVEKFDNGDFRYEVTENGISDFLEILKKQRQK